MGSARIIGIIFKNWQVYRRQSQLRVQILQPLLDSQCIIMIESKGPNYGIEVIPLLKYLNAL
jgi:hypothetical protein